MKFLDGYKTYLGAIAWGTIKIAVARGWMTADAAAVILPVVYAWTGIAVRSALKKGGAHKAAT
jgi:hypothetical protein